MNSLGLRELIDERVALQEMCLMPEWAEDADKPLFLGEALLQGRDNLITYHLNEPWPGVQVPAEPVPVTELVPRMDPDELDAAPPSFHRWLEVQIRLAASLNLNDPVIEAVFTRAFPDGSKTRALIETYKVRQGSLAEARFGAGTVVKDEDVGAALGPERHAAIVTRDRPWLEAQRRMVALLDEVRRLAPREEQARRGGPPLTADEASQFAQLERDYYEAERVVTLYREKRERGDYGAL